MTKICKYCQKEYKTNSKESNFCSNKCRNLYTHQNDPLISIFKNVKGIEEVPENYLKEIHTKDLYEISKRLKRHNLFEILEKYRNFRKTTKLCKNCNQFYIRDTQNNSKCPLCFQSQGTNNPSLYIDKNKNQSKIYQLLKNFETFKSIPVGILKGLRNHNRNQVLSQTKKYLPHLYEELKFHWDNYRICPHCGQFFKRLKSQHRNYECCGKEECQEKYHNNIKTRNSKIKQTTLNRYGVNWYSKTSEFIEKTKNSNPFYNYDWQLQNISKIQENAGGYDKWLQRQRENSIKFQNSLTDHQKQDIKTKREQTTLEKFGVKNVFELIEKCSKTETEFLNEYENKNNVKIDRQYRINRMFVDGFIKPNIIIEFLGDYWHGYRNNEELNEKVNKTFKELYMETFNRFQRLKELGYRIYYIWETDYKTSGLQGLREYE